MTFSAEILGRVAACAATKEDHMPTYDDAPGLYSAVSRAVAQTIFDALTCDSATEAGARAHWEVAASNGPWFDLAIDVKDMARNEWRTGMMAAIDEAGGRFSAGAMADMSILKSRSCELQLAINRAREADAHSASLEADLAILRAVVASKERDMRRLSEVARKESRRRSDENERETGRRIDCEKENDALRARLSALQRMADDHRAVCCIVDAVKQELCPTTYHCVVAGLRDAIELVSAEASVKKEIGE